MPKFIIAFKKFDLGAILVQQIKDVSVLRFRGSKLNDVIVKFKNGYEMAYRGVIYDPKRKCFLYRSRATNVDYYVCLHDNVFKGLRTALSLINDDWYNRFKMLAVSLMSYCSLFSSNKQITDIMAKMETNCVVITKASGYGYKIIGTKSIVPRFNEIH